MAKRKKRPASKPASKTPDAVPAVAAMQAPTRLSPEAWHIVEVLDTAAVKCYVAESESEVAARVATMLAAESQVFVFRGLRVYTSKPPYPHLLMPDGRRIPLFSVPSEDQLEIDDMKLPVQALSVSDEEKKKVIAGTAVAELDADDVDDAEDVEDDDEDDDDFDDDDDDDDDDDTDDWEDDDDVEDDDDDDFDDDDEEDDDDDD